MKVKLPPVVSDLCDPKERAVLVTMGMKTFLTEKERENLFYLPGRN